MRQKIAVQLTQDDLDVFQIEADRKKRSRKQILELILEREAQKLRSKLCKESEKSS
jgi:sporulation-control protein spo0M